MMTDRQMLEILDAVDRRGLSYDNAIAELRTSPAFRRDTLTRGKVAGVVARCRKGADAIGGALDGTMPARWWEPYLEARGE